MIHKYRLFSSIGITLFSLILSASYLNAEKPNKSTRQGTSEKSEESKNQNSEKPGDSSKARSPDKPGIDDINNSWMGTIHGKPGAENTNTEQKGNDSESEKKSGKGNSESVTPTERNQEVSQLLTPEKEEAPSFVGTLFRFIVLMGIMIVLLYFTLRFLRSKSGGMAFGSGGLVEVIASVPLVQGKSLQIVDVAGRLLVLGVSDHGINLITPVEDARSADKIRLFQSQKKDVMPAGLLSELSSLIKRSDYKFWQSEKEKKQGEDFQKVFARETMSPVLTAEKLPEETESELAELISRQRRKIANLKFKKSAEE